MSQVPAIKVVVVEDDEDVRVGCCQALELAGFGVRAYASVEQVSPALGAGEACVVLSDVKLPGMQGTEWQRSLHAIDPELPVILMTGHGDISMAVQAMRAGAYDFVEKPCSSERLVAVVRRAADKRALTLQVQQLRHQLENWHGIEAALIGRSPQMTRVRRTVMALASTPADVVIYGETGTGKELVARCLHDHS